MSLYWRKAILLAGIKINMGEANSLFGYLGGAIQIDFISWRI